MTEEDKKILLKDLCGKLPHHPRVRVKNIETNEEFDSWFTFSTLPKLGQVKYELKPFLRPMSSMTEEEKKTLTQLKKACLNKSVKDEYLVRINNFYEDDVVDWLDENMFDYRNLIGKGLAIKVTDEFNPYKDKPVQKTNNNHE